MEMLKSGDFVELFGPDLSTLIFSSLNDPADIVRASSVSHSWRQFVIENGFCKSLCLKIFPELSRVAHAIEVENVIELMQAVSNNSKEPERSEKNHRVYAILARGLSPILREDCLSKAISASSTDHYPLESIHHTLEPRDNVERRPSYWSSAGTTDDEMPERLTYKLVSTLCSITEVNIHPYQVFFHEGHPVYSAKAVRFRLGHFKYVEVLAAHTHTLDIDDFFEWTYVSPEFPMTQENCLQKFKLPEPVLCIGGILQIELLGRAQRCWDGFYYLCVSHVKVVGRTLLPGFEVKCIKGKCMVNYSPED